MGIEEVRQQYIGKVGEPIELEVDRTNIKMYAQAVGDLSPLYVDDEYAKKSKYGGLVAPPAFFGWPAKPAGGLPALMMEFVGAIMGAGFPALLDGGCEFEFYKPIMAGDDITGTPKIEDLMERTTKSGKKMAVGTISTEYKNQKGEVVALSKNSLLCLSFG